MVPEETPNETPTSSVDKVNGPGPGERLREARESRGLTLDEVAERLHLGRKQVVAIEEDDYSYVPALIYAKGHLRLYAQLVGLSVNEVLKAFDALELEERVPASKPAILDAKPISPEEKYSFLTNWLSYGFVLLLIILTALWWLHHRDVRHKAAPPVQQTSVSQSQPTQTAPSGSGPIPLTIPPQQNFPMVNAPAETTTPVATEPAPQYEDNSQE